MPVQKPAKTRQIKIKLLRNCKSIVACLDKYSQLIRPPFPLPRSAPCRCLWKKVLPHLFGAEQESETLPHHPRLCHFHLFNPSNYKCPGVMQRSATQETVRLWDRFCGVSFERSCGFSVWVCIQLWGFKTRVSSPPPKASAADGI